jgi:hypothetical protein
LNIQLLKTGNVYTNFKEHTRIIKLSLTNQNVKKNNK